MKNNKGFTLIEILAVIVVIGILMIIVIPSVSQYISGSKNSTYITHVNKYIDEAINEITSFEWSVGNEDYTYYIPTNCLDTENKSNESPYGEFVKSYVVVTYSNGKNEYYYTAYDETGRGILLTHRNLLDESQIRTDMTGINTTVGVGSREYVYVYNDSCDKTSTRKEKQYSIQESGKLENEVPPDIDPSTQTNPSAESSIVCKAVKDVTKLHKKTCARTSDGCAAKIGNGKIITYGTLVNGSPKAGDAYDCKVTIDGDYTERFYYVGSDGDKSILVYYKNINNQTTYAYYSSRSNCNGPRVGYRFLPDVTTWNNPGIIAPGTRQIVNENGGSTSSNPGGASCTLPKFRYQEREYKAARLLTYQEITRACGTVLLDNCTWLLENIGQFEGTSGAGGYWLETPTSNRNYFAYCVVSSDRRILSRYADDATYNGIRPVITVLTSSIEN